MRLSDVFLSLGRQPFGQLVRGMSIGKLKTYQLYESFKARAHLGKLNTETVRKAIPGFWKRLEEHDEDFAKELAQGILLAHFEMIQAVLDFLKIPNENGFFAKDLDASAYLTAGWQQRVFENFRRAFPEPALVFYINHLAWELDKTADIFAPAGGA